MKLKPYQTQVTGRGYEVWMMSSGEWCIDEIVQVKYTRPSFAHRRKAITLFTDWAQGER